VVGKGPAARRARVGDARRAAIFPGGRRAHRALLRFFLLNVRGIPKILAVVDDDLTSVTSDKCEVENVFVTDDHDLESMILASEALERVVVELADPAKVAALTARETCSLRVAKYTVEGAGESSDKKSNVLAQVRDATLIVAIYLYFTYRLRLLIECSTGRRA
jgi:hypothetical protein